MLETSHTVGTENSLEASEVMPSEVEVKPKRKRAPRKVRAGLSKGMMITLSPSPKQAVLLRQWAGASRWIWNWALAEQNKHYRTHVRPMRPEIRPPRWFARALSA